MYEIYESGLLLYAIPAIVKRITRLDWQGGEMTEQTRRSELLNEMINYYATPNAYADRFMSYLTSDEWKIVSYGCRRTFGFGNKQDHISISQFVHGAMMYDGSGYRDRGTGLCKSTATKCLVYLNEVGVMRMIANNNRQTNKGALWALELDYEKIDIRALEERFERRQQANRDRMEKPRTSRRGQSPSSEGNNERAL